jgi:signal recognition particle receptor subunit beta
MTLPTAMRSDLSAFDEAECDEARVTVGAAKLDLRRRYPMHAITDALRTYNARLDDINRRGELLMMERGRRPGRQ